MYMHPYYTILRHVVRSRSGKWGLLFQNGHLKVVALVTFPISVAKYQTKSILGAGFVCAPSSEEYSPLWSANQWCSGWHKCMARTSHVSVNRMQGMENDGSLLTFSPLRNTPPRPLSPHLPPSPLLAWDPSPQDDFVHNSEWVFPPQLTFGNIHTDMHRVVSYS